MRNISEVKCKVEFAEDTRFDVPIRRAIRTRARWLHDILLLLRVRPRDRKRAPPEQSDPHGRHVPVCDAPQGTCLGRKSPALRPRPGESWNS
jgi:hypothetical protein